LSDYGDCRGNERNANVLEYGKNRKDYQVMIRMIGRLMVYTSVWLFSNYVTMKLVLARTPFGAEFVFIVILVNLLIIGVILDVEDF
jgi:hypothetical protein